MSIFDWFRSEPTQLKLQDTSYGVSKIGMPKAPALDVSLESLQTYSRKSELVYACIEKKAQAACDAEIVVEKRTSKDDWEPVDSHPLVNLLNKPNQWDNGESFLRSWIASENFSDLFYAEIVRSGAGVPVGLYPLNPVHVSPQYSMSRSGQWVLDFYYYYNNGMPVKLMPDELLIRRRHGLGSVYSDVSAVSIALGSVDADAAATDYVRAFFNNGGSPSGIINIKDRRLSDTEAQAYQQKWTQRFGRNGTSRAGIAVLDSAVAEYQAVGAGLNELDNGALNAKIETRICMAFGVPPILIGALVGLEHITQNATSKAAMADFWQYTMSPELKSIRKFLTYSLLPMFEPIEAIMAGTIRVNWDMSQVSALQDDLDDLAKRAVAVYQGGIANLNESRAMVKLDAVEDETGEEFYKAPAPIQVQGQNPDEKPKPPKEDEKPKAEHCPECGELAYFAKFRYCAAERKQFIDVLDADTLEKKTVDFDGLTLGREPQGVELVIDLKGMARDYDTGREDVAKVLLSLRSDLIKQSVTAIEKIRPENVHELALVPPDKAYARVKKVTERLFATGQRQVADDLRRQQGKGKWVSATSELDAGFINAELNGTLLDLESTSELGSIEVKKTRAEWQALIDRIVERTISRVINEIQTRAINFFVARGLLDENDDAIIAELRAALEDQSTKTFDRMAQETANVSIGTGRDAELEERKDEIELFEYSAILDNNTCGTCSDADGMQAADADDLPEAPNPDCDGNAACRCFRVGIGHEENA